MTFPGPRGASRCVWVLVLALASWGTVASAQPTAGQKAAAEAVFDQALSLLKAGSLEEACERFEQSQQIDPAVGTLLYLAECYERTGRLASAWATFREAASIAEASGQEERARVGSERARKLEPLLSYMTYEVGDNSQLDGFRLSLDGKSVAPAILGVPVPIDPGVHQLQATAPGHETWQLQVQVPVQPSRQKVEVPVLKAMASDPEPAVLPAPEAASTSTTMTEPVEAPAGVSADHTWVWVSAGVGVVGLGVGVVFGLRAAELDDEAQELCNGTLCFDRAGEEKSQQASDAALVANIGYGVGAAGLVTSLVLAVIANEETSASATPRNPVARATSRHDVVAGWQLAPAISASGGGLNLKGAF